MKSFLFAAVACALITAAVVTAQNQPTQPVPATQPAQPKAAQAAQPRALPVSPAVMMNYEENVELYEAQRDADDFLEPVEAGTPHVVAWQVFAIRAELRLARGDAAGAPAAIRPVTRSRPGVSAERTAYPSIAELGNGGRSMRAAAGSASTRPAAASTGTVSARSGVTRARTRC